MNYRLAEVHEVMIATVPDSLVSIPEGIIKGRLWWEMLTQLNERRLAGNLRPASAPRDVEVVLVRSPDEVRAISLRHPCADCVAGTMRAIAALESGTKMLGVIQVTMDMVLSN